MLAKRKEQQASPSSGTSQIPRVRLAQILRPCAACVVALHHRCGSEGPIPAHESDGLKRDRLIHLQARQIDSSLRACTILPLLPMPHPSKRSLAISAIAAIVPKVAGCWLCCCVVVMVVRGRIQCVELHVIETPVAARIDP